MAPTVPPDLRELTGVPHGATARRLDWLLLPPVLRSRIERQLGSRVVDAESAGSGFTPGFASVLTGADGRRQFVKAASTKAQRPFADAYREEIRKLQALPSGLPVPRLLWTYEDDLWVVLGLEYVEGRAPERPWQVGDLHRCLDTLEELAEALTPAPLSLRSFADDFAECLDGWKHLRRVAPHHPHLDEAEALAHGYAEATAGRTLVHTDARDDNFLLRDPRAGGAVLCDWNWPVVGAAWIDSVLLLISAYGDGVDVETVLAGRTLTRDVDPAHVDTLLALICGYFMETRDRPVPTSSPYLRVHARWYSEVTWSWLARRQGWT